MAIMDLDDLAQRLKTADLPAVALATGLAYNTLKNIRNGLGARFSTVKALSYYFQSNP